MVGSSRSASDAVSSFRNILLSFLLRRTHLLMCVRYLGWISLHKAHKGLAKTHV